MMQQKCETRKQNLLWQHLYVVLKIYIYVG